MMMRVVLLSGLVAVLAALAAGTHADPFAGYGTGGGESGQLPASGVRTPHHAEFDPLADTEQPAADDPAEAQPAAQMPQPPRTLTMSTKATGRALPGEPLAQPTPPRHLHQNVHPPDRRFYTRHDRKPSRWGRDRYRSRSTGVYLNLSYRIQITDRVQIRLHRHHRYDRPPRHHRRHRGRGSSLRLHLRY